MSLNEDLEPLKCAQRVSFSALTLKPIQKIPRYKEDFVVVARLYSCLFLSYESKILMWRLKQKVNKL